MWTGLRSGDALVVYCAHDAVFSEPILREFSRRTGIDLNIRFDTEATKSLGLVELIRRERNRPRCDVFWNNEQLGTMALAEDGLLEPYRGEGFARIAPTMKDSDGRWTGFAGRARVWIVNTDTMPATREAIEAELTKTDLSRLAVAKPLFGTTRTHYTVLWDHLGGDALHSWHRSWRDRGVVEAGGNAMVKNLVAEGACRLGLTDTDDFYAALDAGKPVAMVPVWIERVPETAPADPFYIVIPNTVAIVRGTKRPDEAERLVEYLLSEQTELALARSASRQVPLGRVDEERLPEEVRSLRTLVGSAYSLGGLRVSAAACLEWLRSEYLR